MSINVTSDECRVTRGQKAGGYRLANCVALLGALVADDRTQLPRVMDLMRHALTADKYLDDTGTRAERVAPAWQALADEVRAKRRSANVELLEWAKSRASAGIAWRVVSKAEPVADVARPARRQGQREQPGVIRALVFKALGDTSKTADEIAAMVKITHPSVKHHLVMLAAQGLVRVVGRRQGGIGRKPELWRKIEGAEPVSGDNRFLWLNNGTWWMRTTCYIGKTKERIARSLGTSDVQEARRRRDEFLLAGS